MLPLKLQNGHWILWLAAIALTVADAASPSHPIPKEWVDATWGLAAGQHLNIGTPS